MGWKAGLYRPKDSWVPPLLCVCTTSLACWPDSPAWPLAPALRSRTHVYHLWYLQFSSPLKISPRELTWCRLSRMMTSGISTALFSLLHWSARLDRYWRSSYGGQKIELGISLLRRPTRSMPSLTKAKAGGGRSPYDVTLWTQHEHLPVAGHQYKGEGGFPDPPKGRLMTSASPCKLDSLRTHVGTRHGNSVMDGL